MAPDQLLELAAPAVRYLRAFTTQCWLPVRASCSGDALHQRCMLSVWQRLLRRRGKACVLYGASSWCRGMCALVLRRIALPLILGCVHACCVLMHQAAFFPPLCCPSQSLLDAQRTWLAAAAILTWVLPDVGAARPLRRPAGPERTNRHV